MPKYILELPEMYSDTECGGCILFLEKSSYCRLLGVYIKSVQHSKMSGLCVAAERNKDCPVKKVKEHE